MNVINRVLIPIDFSESAMNAVNYVLGMADRDEKIKIFLYHVESQNSDLVQQKLIDIKTKMFDSENIECDVVLAVGEFVEKLIEDQARLKIDLVVMGMADNKNGNQSFTVDLLQGADCPLLIVPAKVDGFKLNDIALTLDEEEFDSSNDLRVFHDIAKWFNAKVHLIKVDRDGKGGAHALKTEDTLDYYLESLEYHYSFPKNNDLEKGILEYVKEKNIDALAIMPKTHAQKSIPSEGRLTKALAKHIEVPLLILD
ncbi:universal stress protein [Reichenbachiella sp.]|uniref:universal stress protein n=1 Tax=Reichenbachiella sp. TaxID=2184521 RepID=UPI003B5AB336